ncbi:MAG TPA: hypothetical protein VK337_05685 [Xanthobacteraceae bacterium]|nr:hypothetical protein [Xanthobacteraceae bacterium]
MTATRRASFLARAGSAAVVVLALAGCTPGGQFDPTSLFANDMFDTKTKLKGDREPVFPNGVPGTSSGIPQDLVKGYQPPPDQAADTTAPDAAAEEAAKNKPKPKPKVARAPATPPRRINIGPKPNQAAPATPQGVAPAPPASSQQSQQSPFPPPPPTAPAQQAAPTVESRWPDPPKPGTQ